MAQSKLSPVNVILWCCVLIFAATAVASVALMFFPDILKLKESQQDKLFTLLILEIVAIAVAVFSQKLLGKKTAEKPEIKED
jgi:hypothetical protein